MPHAIRTDGLLDTVAGLPVHPLLVHAVVILLPLASLALVAVVPRPGLRAAYATPAVAVLVASAVAAFLAEESGEALAARVGTPEQHAEYAEVLVPVALATAAVATAWWVLQRRGTRLAGAPGDARAGLTRGLGLVAAVLALSSVGLTGLVGHSGAKAVWAGTSGASSADSGSSALGLTDVAGHAEASDCWVIVDDSVYDLTDWVHQHPGGPDRIADLCGTDATAAFSAQHGTQPQPAAAVDRFRIGTFSEAGKG